MDAQTAAATVTIANPYATGGLAMISALFVQYLKNSGWATWFTRETNRANLALSVLLAGLASFGIHYTWDAATDTLAIVGLTFALKHGIWDWLLQWVTQHAAYKGLIVPAETLGEIRALLQRDNPPPISQGEAKAQDESPTRRLGTIT
jgi:hypothetical protein